MANKRYDIAPNSIITTDSNQNEIGINISGFTATTSSVLSNNYIASGGTVSSGDTFERAISKLDGQLIQLSYAKFSNATIQTFLTNIQAINGSVNPTELSAALYFLQGLIKIGINTNCIYANLGIGDYLAAQTNLIYQGANIYVSGYNLTTPVGIGSGNWDRVKGWQLGAGLTYIDTNFDFNGYSIGSFTMQHGLTENTNNTNRTLFGYGSNQGILKTSDNYGFSVAIFQGKTNIFSPFEALSNIQGDHILVQGATGCQWYRDGVLHNSSTGSATGAFAPNKLIIGARGLTYGVCFNKALVINEALALNELMIGVQAILGRQSSKLDIKSIVFEGTSQTASYVPPFNTYSPRYPIQVMTALQSVDVFNTRVSQPASSGKLTSTMLTEATADYWLLNTNNFNNKRDNILIYEGGINDIGNDPALLSADFVYDTYVVPYLQNRISKGYTVLVETIPSFSGNCTYSFGVAGGQANYNSASLGSRRLNYRIKSDPRNYNGINAHGVILTDEIPEFQDATNTTYFQDGLHFTGTGAAPIRAKVTANVIKSCIGRKSFELSQYQSEIPQLITSDLVPSSSSGQSSYRTFKNFVLDGTFNFTLPNPMLFFGTQYILINKSGIQTIIGTIDGISNSTLSIPYSKIKTEAVRTGTNTFEWVTITQHNSSTLRTSATTLSLSTGIKSYFYGGNSSTTWTLPLISTSTNVEYYIKNTGTANITLITQSSNQIFYTSPDSSLNIVPSSAYILQNDGVYWQVM